MKSVCISAEVLERVVAIVDDKVVLLSEFEETLLSAGDGRNIYTKKDVINQMINRIILLREARKFGFKKSIEDPEDAKAVVKEYIDRRIKAFIHIPYDQIESYYNENRGVFEKKEFYDVKDEIEEYLVSQELVKRLREYIEEQRNKSYIRIQLEDQSQSVID